MKLWIYDYVRVCAHINNARGYEKITIFEQYLALYRKWCKIEPYLLWKANRKPHPSFRLVPVWMTFSDLQPHLKVTSIQRQINSKMVQHWAIPQWQTNRKSYKMFYRTTLFSMTLNDPTSFQGHAILWRWIYQNRYEIQTSIFNGILIGTHTRHT